MELPFLVKFMNSISTPSPYLIFPAITTSDDSPTHKITLLFVQTKFLHKIFQLEHNFLPQVFMTALEH